MGLRLAFRSCVAWHLWCWAFGLDVKALGFWPQVVERDVYCDLWLKGGLCRNLCDFKIRHFPTILESTVLIEGRIGGPNFELRRYLPLGVYPRMIEPVNLGWSKASLDVPAMKYGEFPQKGIPRNPRSYPQSFC